ncbi:hypothetical protein ACFVHB_02225 [Kitasatospora sp. NPDC127111]|uniref:hypothetical protein n=1 Tax=Kitasatospora sp. NPDC127111 TaxID=3345363 RepID=UPI00363ACC23
MTVALYDHEPAAGDPLPGSPAAFPSEQAAETTAPPVFVDSSGRRQRRVRRLGLVLAVPAAGYLVLLASTVLGGPTVNAPFLPLPAAPSAAAPAPAEQPPDPEPTITGTPGPDSVQPGSARATAPDHRNSTPETATTRPPAPAAGPSAPPPAATPGGNGNGNATGAPTAAPTPGHGRPTDAPGNSGNTGGKAGKPSPTP